MVAPVPQPVRAQRGLAAAIARALERQEAAGAARTRLNAWTLGLSPEWAALIERARSPIHRDALRALGLAGDIPLPVIELAAIPGRRFRFDIAWPERLVYCEIDGGTYINGRHARGSGISSDCEKFSLASGMGWRVVRVDSPWVRERVAFVGWIRDALEWRSA